MEPSSRTLMVWIWQRIWSLSKRRCHFFQVCQFGPQKTQKLEGFEKKTCGDFWTQLQKNTDFGNGWWTFLPWAAKFLKVCKSYLDRVLKGSRGQNWTHRACRSDGRREKKRPRREQKRVVFGSTLFQQNPGKGITFGLTAGWYLAKCWGESSRSSCFCFWNAVGGSGCRGKAWGSNFSNLMDQILNQLMDPTFSLAPKLAIVSTFSSKVHLTFLPKMEVLTYT